MVDWQAGAGERGLKVLLLQRALVKEGFASPVTGYYDSLPARVLAFRKTNEIGRDGYAIKPCSRWWLRGEGAFKLRYPKAGKHVEFDWSRQVLVLANGPAPTGPTTPRRGARHADRVRHLPLLPADAGHEREGHGPLVLLHRRLRDPRLRVGAELPGEPRLPAGADPERGCQIFNWIDIGDPIFTYR